MIESPQILISAVLRALNMFGNAIIAIAPTTATTIASSMIESPAVVEGVTLVRFEK